MGELAPERPPTVELDDDGNIANSTEVWNYIAEEAGLWSGVPFPLDGTRVILEPRFPRREALMPLLDRRDDEERVRTYSRTCSSEDIDEGFHVRNVWYSRSKNAYVTLYYSRGKLRYSLDYRYRYTERLNLWLQTMGASRAWDLDAELRARGKLAEMISEQMYKMYELTGSFIEESPRSKVIYMLRSGRPTIAVRPFRPWIEDSPLRAIGVLCLHPLAYYERTWAGAMVPTDDIIAHLLLIRGDEHMFWRRANQHHPESPEAGI